MPSNYTDLDHQRVALMMMKGHGIDYDSARRFLNMMFDDEANEDQERRDMDALFTKAQTERHFPCMTKNPVDQIDEFGGRRR